MADQGFVHRFMRATGRLRTVFGPADRGTTEGELTAQSRAQLARLEAEARQWTRVQRPDGSTYLVRETPVPGPNQPDSTP
ncbi:hypothetical protein BGP79_07550 [Tersicoccus sp. Bi-70]|nr:hypothetical protein [Tersicoccus sp. Bi-70]OMH32298.1 hypothetical protein BGP79_07550 [Tersicoccus sp. Bi-70]